MKLLRRHSILLTALVALYLCNLPATASVILFSDLGSGNSAYDSSTFWNVCGTGGCGTSSMTIATSFLVGGTGSEIVAEIDLAVANEFSPPATFSAGIFANNAGQPGTQVANAQWNLSTSGFVGDPCCALVSITNIAGVTLIGGQSYFMVLRPMSNSDNSVNGWFYNNLGQTGHVLSSIDGGASWVDEGAHATLGAFDVVGAASTTPESGSLLLLGTGLIGIFSICRRKATLPQHSD